MRNYLLSTAFCLFLLGLFCHPAKAQLAYGLSNEPMEQLNSLVDWTSLLGFYVAVVYFGASIALTMAKRFYFGLVNLGISIFAFGVMTFEPLLYGMVSMTGLKYSVKLTIHLALCSVSLIALLACLFLPILLALIKKSKWRIVMVPLNIAGIVVFPLFILSLYMVQNDIAEQSNETAEAKSAGDDKQEDGEPKSSIEDS